MKNKPTIKVCCAIILKDERILAVQRSTSMALAGKWEFPGGKLEPAESESDCIIREIKEELNIVIQPKKKLSLSLWEDDKRFIQLIPFICTWEAGELQLREHVDMKWVTPSGLTELDLAEADIPIAIELQKILD